MKEDYFNSSNIQLMDELVSRYKELLPIKDNILDAYVLLAESFIKGGKLLIAGNGGSAADSEHIVGELMKGFVKTRPVSANFKEMLCNINNKDGAMIADKLQGALPAIALSGHEALSTAYLNDVDGMLVYAQQVYGYGVGGDILLAITTSGNSKNVIYAADVAKAKGMKVIALTGKDGGVIKNIADVSIVVPCYETYKIQELHLPIYHALCLMLEDYFFDI